MINPVFVFFAIFVVAPLVELYVLIQVGSVVGALPTILICIFTAVLGGWLVRVQGFSVLFRARQMMERGEVPALEILEGAVLLLAGLALMLPGFITDAVGFLLLVPPVRRAVILWVLRRRGVLRPGQPLHPGGPQDKSQGYIEGEYRKED